MQDRNTSTRSMMDVIVEENENLFVQGKCVLDRSRPYTTDCKGVPLPNTLYYQICECSTVPDANRICNALKLLAHMRKAAFDNGGHSFLTEVAGTWQEGKTEND